MNGSLFSEPKYMNGVGFGNVGPHLRIKMTPWLPPEVTIDALSKFDAINMIITAYPLFLSYFLNTAETSACLCIIR